MVKIATQAGDGAVAFAQESVVITCTNALAKGDVVTLTLASGKFSACTKHGTGDSTPDHILGVASDAVAAGAKGRIVLRGVVDAKCEIVSAGATVVGSATTGGRLEAQGTNPADNGGAFEKVVGVALTAAASAGDSASILFDGINGFSSPGNV
tara:strand:+ start:3557 stop:4015 length:459 start_codon:yes stop_codon:yes gene_type:complete